VKNLFKALLAFSTVVVVPSTALAGPGAGDRDVGNARVGVCHVHEDGSANLINVSERALPGHVGHGDALPGEPAPDASGFVFDPTCQLQQEAPPAPGFELSVVSTQARCNSFTETWYLEVVVAMDGPEGYEWTMPTPYAPTRRLPAHGNQVRWADFTVPIDQASFDHPAIAHVFDGLDQIDTVTTPVLVANPCWPIESAAS